MTRAIDVLAAARERGRVERDNIETLLGIAQIFRGIGMDQFGAAQAVQFEVALRPCARARRSVDGDHLRRAAAQRRKREASRVAVSVEDARASAQRREGRAILALVEEGSGL